MNKNQVDEVLKLDNQLCFPLYAASRLIIQSYSQAFEKLGITYSQYLVLLVLWQKDNQTVSEIGEKLFLDSGTLTPVLKKMSAAGLIERQRSQDDDRQVLNQLTTKSKLMKQKTAEMSFDLFCRSGLKVEEAQSLRQSLNFMIKVLTTFNQRH